MFNKKDKAQPIEVVFSDLVLKCIELGIKVELIPDGKKCRINISKRLVYINETNDKKVKDALYTFEMKDTQTSDLFFHFSNGIKSIANEFELLKMS